MLQVSSLTKSYGADPVLHDVSFTLSPGERIGLVGPNGSGKSTLMQVIAGTLQPDRGSVWIDPASSVAYLPQYPLDELHLSVHDALLRGSGRAGELPSLLAQLEGAMESSSGTDLDELLERYAAVRDEFERLGGYALESRMQRVVDGLALDVPDFGRPVAALSGGNKTKLSLARLLLSGADILLLDEPTNYLDLPALLWLESYVTAGDRSYLIVSHDRRFLDRTVSSILELSPSTHTVREWAGSYSDYAEGRLREQQKHLEMYRDQQEEIARIEEDIRRTKEQARGVEARTKSGPGADHARRLAKKVARKATTRERRLEKQLESPDLLEKPTRGWGLHLVDLGRGAIEDDRLVMEVEGLSVAYGDYEVLRSVDLLMRGQDRLALLGENGSGKTTLVRCLSGELPYTGRIRLGASIRPGILSQEGRELAGSESVLEAFRLRTELHEDEARTYLHKFLFSGEEVFKRIDALSYGQRAKLALAILIASNANFLVLDEPTSHMDMPALQAIERALSQYRGPLLVVSHDRYFLERIGITRASVIEQGTLRPVSGVEAYEEEVRAREALHA